MLIRLLSTLIVVRQLVARRRAISTNLWPESDDSSRVQKQGKGVLRSYANLLASVTLTLAPCDRTYDQTVTADACFCVFFRATVSSKSLKALGINICKYRVKVAV
jgi:hypothetical protein